MPDDQAQSVEGLSQELGDIRQQIDALKLPTASYAAIGLAPDIYYISVVNDDETVTVRSKSRNADRHQEVIDWLRAHTERTNTKIIAAAILGADHAELLGERLWLEEDIVPLWQEGTEATSEAQVQDAAWAMSREFDELHLVRVPLSADNEVGVSHLVTLSAYQATVPAAAWEFLQEQVARFQALNNRLVFVNATPQGGGVALMRHALFRLFRLLEVDAHWHVLQPNQEVFRITKTKFHNVLQQAVSDNVVLSKHDEELYLAWIKENDEILREALAAARVVVIDDPQPSGLIPLLREAEPERPIMYRSHIHLDDAILQTPGTSAQHTWQFLWERIQGADVFISHPIDNFIPQEAQERAVTMSATTDPLDGLNKELGPREMDYYLKLFDTILLEHAQEPLDMARPYLVQIARFDPSKGIPDVIEAFAQLRTRMEKEGHTPLPQLVLAGHGSIDDPDGVPVYNMVLHLIQTRYQRLADDIKVVRLHHNDQILNALVRGSRVVLQLSHREGFEVKVTEALAKGKPVVAFRAGGIPLQIIDGESGYLVDIGDCATVAERLWQLCTDEGLYERMSQAARERISPHYFTVYNAIKWLFLANELAEGKQLAGQGRAVKDIIGAPLA